MIAEQQRKAMREVAIERDVYREELAYAQSVINELETHIAKIRGVFARYRTSLSEQQNDPMRDGTDAGHEA